MLSISNWIEFWPFKQTVWLESHNPLISLSDMHLRLLSQWDQEVQREKRHWRIYSFQFQLTKSKLRINLDMKFLFSCSTRHLTRSLWDVKSGAELRNADWPIHRALFLNNGGTFGNRLLQFWENVANTHQINP